MSNTRKVVRANNQILFVGSIIVLSIIFAAGFSITLFGLTTPYMATETDKLITVAIGSGLIVGSSASVYMIVR